MRLFSNFIKSAPIEEHMEGIQSELRGGGSKDETV